MTVDGDVVLTGAGEVVTAMRGEAVLGFLHLRTVPGAVAVEALFVDAAMRGTGVGRALWHAAEAAARTAGAARIVVEAETPAIGFYEAMGCVVIGDRAGACGPTPMEKALA